MNTLLPRDVHQAAVDCVESMGDILWDYRPERDIPLDFHNPFDIAVENIEKTLQKVVAESDSAESILSALRTKYTAIVAKTRTSSADAELVTSLIEKADWTEHNAGQIVRLARRHGATTLRKALAIAEVLGIETD